MSARLKSKLRIQAAVRICSAAGISAMVVARGDEDAGQLLLKMNRLEAGCEVLAEVRDRDGALVWMNASGTGLISETDADAYLARQRQIDPDLWILEIEDREGRNPLTGQV
jgi:GMP synthase (glutamine-hydrolysing)